jgi:hypothetical protein
MLPNPLYEGTAVTTTCTFTTAAGALMDPSVITVSYRAGSAAAVTWTYGGGQITRVSQGVYTAELDTTNNAGYWQVKWTGTGACAAVSLSTFPVTATPF